MSVIVKMIAKNPSTILLAGAFILLMLGYSTDNPQMIQSAWTFFAFGIILNVLWLILRRR